MIETGDLVAGTDTQTLGPAGRLARTAVNQHPRETETDGRVMGLPETETEGMTDLGGIEGRMREDRGRGKMRGREDTEKREKEKRRGRDEKMSGDLRRSGKLKREG